MEANDDSSIKKITSLFSLFSGFIFIHKIDGIDIAMKNETSELNLSLSFDVADFFYFSEKLHHKMLTTSHRVLIAQLDWFTQQFIRI